MKPLIGLVIFIAVVVGLYYLYKFLYSSKASQASVTLLSGVKSATETVTDSSSGGKKAVSVSAMKGVADGGQYSVSFWLYVASTKAFTDATGGKLAHLLEISNDRFNGTQGNRGKTLVFVGLNPLNGSLVVRQSTSDPTEAIDNSATSGTASRYALDSLISSYTASGSAFASDDRCDILNGIEYQRWICVTVVGNGRTLDVYLDGKLARSCVYKANFALGSTAGVATGYVGLDNEDKLKGFFSNAQFYNYALSPEAVWALYQAGPGASLGIADFFKNLFNTAVSFGSAAGLNA
jgi:hypothetical protein